MGAGGDKQSALMVKRYITIIESMTDTELDSTNIKIFAEKSRLMRLARGSGGFEPAARRQLLPDAGSTAVPCRSVMIVQAHTLFGGHIMLPTFMYQASEVE
jgi:hypothetical protein